MVDMTRRAILSEGRGLRVRKNGAVRKPRHNTTIGGKRKPGGLMGRSPGGGKVSFAGVRSPPLRRIGDPSSDGLAGKTLG